MITYPAVSRCFLRRKVANNTGRSKMLSIFNKTSILLSCAVTGSRGQSVQIDNRLAQEFWHGTNSFGQNPSLLGGDQCFMHLHLGENGSHILPISDYFSRVTNMIPAEITHTDKGNSKVGICWVVSLEI